MKISTIERTAEATAFNANMASGKVKFYDGIVPANPQTTPAGALLGTVTLGSPAFTVSSGVCTLIGTPDSLAVATSTTTFARLTKSDDSAIADCTVGTSGAEINLTKLAFVTDETIKILTLTYTVPE